MKHYFVQNPNSGKNQKIDVIKECVIPAAEKAGIDYEIYDTTCKGDATRFCKEKAEEAKKAGENVKSSTVSSGMTTRRSPSSRRARATTTSAFTARKNSSSRWRTSSTASR